VTAVEKPKEVVAARVGVPFTIRLWEDRTRGSRWMPTCDPTGLRFLGDDYARTRNTRVDDVGMRYFEFVGLKPGRYPVAFESRYGWKFSAEDRIVYEVEITH